MAGDSDRSNGENVLARMGVAGTTWPEISRRAGSIRNKRLWHGRRGHGGGGPRQNLELVAENLMGR